VAQPEDIPHGLAGAQHDFFEPNLPFNLSKRFGCDQFDVVQELQDGAGAGGA
jgi:hypothetical protein